MEQICNYLHKSIRIQKKSNIDLLLLPIYTELDRLTKIMFVNYNKI